MFNTKTALLPYSARGLTTVYAVIQQQNTGYCLDNTTGLFISVKNPVASKFCVPAAEDSVLKGVYVISDARALWPDGPYLIAWYNRKDVAPAPATDVFVGTTTLNVGNDLEIPDVPLTSSLKTKVLQLPYYIQGLATVYAIIQDLDTGECLDNTTGSFAAVANPTPAKFLIPAASDPTLKGIYTISESRTTWPDGLYLAVWYNQLGADPDPSADTFLGTTPLNLAKLSGGNFTLNDIAVAIRVDVKDQGKAKYDDTTILKIINDGVDILHSILCNFTPNMFRKTIAINLTKNDGYGPYVLDSGKNYKRLEWIEDQNGSRIAKSRRGADPTPLGTGAPAKYFLEGMAPTKVYFDMTPDKAYAYTAYFIESISRATSLAQAYPLPDNTFVPIVFFCDYALLNMNEYATMDEEKKVQLFMAHLSDDLLSTGEEIELEFYGGYADGPSDVRTFSSGNPLDL